MFSIGDLIGDASFLGNAALLILGAVLTGFLVPFVKARLDDASARRKQLLEAELARQSEFLQSQIDLLTSFSDATWEFLFDAFKVSYAEAWEEEAAKNAAWEAYEPLSWKHLGKIRAIISKSKRLLSEACHKNLIATYDWLWHYDDELAIHLLKGTLRRNGGGFTSTTSPRRRREWTRRSHTWRTSSACRRARNSARSNGERPRVRLRRRWGVLSDACPRLEPCDGRCARAPLPV